MGEEQPPRPVRPGAPRRPHRHRARAGGSARAVGGQAPPQRIETPTRALPVAPGPDAAPPTRPGDPAAPAPGSSAWDSGQVPAPSRGSRHARRPRWSRAPRPLRLAVSALALLLVLTLGWGAGLLLWANSRIDHIDALSGRADTPGTTYLIAGSDMRDGQAVKDDGTKGKRTDTIMLLHRAQNGRSYLVSLPRDTLVDIPGKGKYKLNAAFAFGGAPLLVKTVEEFSGLTIDHYVEVGFDGVENVVDAVGSVNLCIDKDVDDVRSGLKMTKGCHDVGGQQALAFVRARYFDPTADIGRQQRQQQFVGALMSRAASPGVLLNPIAQARLAGAGSDALTTSKGTGVLALGQMARSARAAMKAGTVVMPVKDPAFRTKHSGIAITTDENEIRAFFSAIEDGSAKPTPPKGG